MTNSDQISTIRLTIPKGEKMDFGTALGVLKAGGKVSREGWNGKGMWLELQVPDQNSKMTMPYVYLNYPTDPLLNTPGARVPWAPSQTDLLSGGWFIVEEPLKK